MSSNKTAALRKKSAAVAIAFLLIIQIIVPFVMQASAASDYVVIVIGSSVNVRSGAGSSNSLVGTAYMGNTYDYLGEGKDADGATWYKVQLSSSKTGWITGKYAFKTKRAEDYTQVFVDNVAKYYGAVGVQVAVIDNGTVTDTYNYGWATKNSEKMTSEHKIRTASVAKVAIAIIAMKMQEQGIVDVNANIGNYWGTKPYKAVTLKSLLSHTSTLKSLSYSPTRVGTLTQLIRADSYNSGTVGDSSVWFYNNYAAGVAGSTLEVASEQTLDAYAKANIFESLGIDAAMTSGLLKDTSKIATLYHSNGNVARSVSESVKLKGSTTPGNNTSLYAGGLTCSAKDLAKMIAMLANDGTYNGVQILTPASVAEIESRLFTTKENSASFHQCMPLRYKANLYGESELYYHTGNAYGVLALASYNPSTRDGVVVLTTGMSDVNTVPACSRDAQGIYEICGKLSEYVYRYRNSSASNPTTPTTTTVATTTTTTTTTAPTTTSTTASTTETTTSATATTAPTEPVVSVESVALNHQHLSISLGETAQLTYAVSPSNAVCTPVWSSSGKCAEVDNNGKVTALGYGTATITVTAGNASTSCTVTVEPDISLKMLGASIRVSGKYGIRFGIQFDKNEFFNKANIVEYGTLIIGSGTLGDAELTLETPSIRRIKADNILSEDSEKQVYTGVLIDIPTSFFKTNVTARGYVIYRDADGNECVEYTQTATKSFDGVARAAYEKYSAIANPSASEQDTINILKALIEQ